VLLPSQVQLVGAGTNTTLCVAVDVRPQRLITIAQGAPPILISNVRILGSLEVLGGELTLSSCGIEPGISDGSILSASDGRALSIEGGAVTLKNTTLSGHLAGAIGVHAATLLLIASTIRNCRALTGAAMLVDGNANVTIDGSTFIANAAETSGGAVQVGMRECPTAAAPHTICELNMLRCTDILSLTPLQADRQRPCASAQPNVL
jgi:hypothetical protein